MNILRLSFLLSITRTQILNDYPCPNLCECSTLHDATENIVEVICSLPYIKPNETNFSVLETNVTSVLDIYCDKYLPSQIGDKEFQHLYSFKKIQFIWCEFETLSEYSLFGLKSLEELAIHKATNLTINEKTFEHTPNLQRLTITSSGLRSFPILTFLPSLTFVNFTDNEINDLSNIDMNGGTHLRLLYLILNDNTIREINLTLHSYMPFVKRIEIADNLISSISPACFHHLNSLEYLDISGNNLSALVNDTFSDNVNLKSLGLGRNRQLQLPSGLLDSLIRLQVLDLHVTDVRDSVWNLLTTVSNINDLSIAGCRITYIDGQTLANLTMLLYFDLSDNEITEIPDFTFLKQTKLELLRLDNIKIKSIASNAFIGLWSLKILHLRNNYINLIPSETFRYATKLMLLNISDNQLTTFPTLKNCVNLYVIDLRYNRIETLNNDSFQGLKNLGGVNLNWNCIDNISSDLLKPTPNIQLLSLSHNNITQISRAVFTGLNSLQWVFLDYNKISDISHIFTALPSLVQLNLTQNNITGFIRSEYFYGSTKLQDIYLGLNQITGVSANAFMNLQYLETVDLTFNKISSLSPQSLSFSPPSTPRSPVFHLKGNPFVCDCNLEWLRHCFDIWTLSCQGLDIHEFQLLKCYQGYRIIPHSLIKDAAIDNMMCKYEKQCNDTCDCCPLEECQCRISCTVNCTCLMSYSRERGIVDCSRLNLKFMNQSIPTVTVTLYLDGNDLDLVTEKMFSGLYQLETLYLNGSHIYRVEDGSFSALRKLKTLFINQNNIEKISTNFLNGLASLEYINLEDNLISSIAVKAFNESLQLKTIRLANNKLSSPVSYLSNLDNLEYVTLGNNQWSCDCNILKQLKTLTYTMAEVIKDRKEMYCTTNSSQNFTSGKLSILELDLLILCPNETHFNHTIELSNRMLSRPVQALIATLVILVLVVTIAIIVFANRKLVQVVLYNKFGFKFGREKSDINKTFDAFVSYSHKDEDFVVRELLPRLETEEGYKLCVHFRDFPVGATIADTIIESIENSQRTIMVLSNNFLDSEWCEYEFKTAHHEVLREKSKKIILILMDNIDSSKFDQELKLYIRTKTYLKHKDPWFWEKLIYAMPELTLKNNHQLNDLNKEKGDVDFNVQQETCFHKNII